MNQLYALKRYSTVVVDSGDIEYINQYSPEDVTTNPSLILNVINLPIYQDLIYQSIDYAKKKGGSYNEKIINATDKIAVNIGAKIIQHIPGYISTEVDARLSFNREECIKKAKKMIQMYEEVGVNRSRILIKLAATWECIRAAEELKKSNINCNLTLLFSFFQARACAEAGVFLISPFVGRIYDWYQAKNPVETYSSDTDPGVISVREIYKYYKRYNYDTIIMGASFRNTNQILALSGCDRLTVSPFLLEKLLHCYDPVQRFLSPSSTISTKPTPLSELEFHENHKKNIMAVEKLSEGIRNFGRDQEKLEKIISVKF